MPIFETLKIYLKQPDVWASFHEKSDGGMLRDFTDGRM